MEQSFQLDQTQILSMVGAVLVLYAFLGMSFWRMDRDGLPYAFLNFLGTFFLALSALSPFNFGIFLVEAVWSAASLILCVKFFRNRRAKV